MAPSSKPIRPAPSLFPRDLERRQAQAAIWEQSTIESHGAHDPNMLFALRANERMIRSGHPTDPTSEYRPMRRPDNDTPSADLLSFAAGRQFKTILADPPWRFLNRTGKIAPEHRRLARYGTMTVDEIAALPVAEICDTTAHLYLWVPNALLPEGLQVMRAWGFNYKSNIVWHKLRNDGGSDGRGVGFYFRNVSELILFGTRGKNARTLAPGRRQVNYIGTRKREHSRKPDEQYGIIESCSPGPFLEMFARGVRPKWATWGDQADNAYEPTWKTYAHNSASMRDNAD